jgi:beta-galactosidase
VEYSGMKEIVWGVWKERENMNADMKWLDNPEVFKVNQLESHSDHCYYLDYSDMKKEKNPLLQSLNGQWEFAYSKNVMERPVDFYKETFDASGFDKIMVPGHIELAGYDKIRYINTMYPWEGKEYHRGAYSMEATGAEEGMFSEAQYNPVGSYIKYFDLDKNMCGKRIYICFEGVEEAMYLWLNGQFIGYAEDSFTPSEFDLTPYVKEKGNVLAVQVHKMSTAAFLEDQDFFRFFGIFRNVTLKAIPDVHLEDVWFKPVLNQDNESGSVSVSMKVSATDSQNVTAGFILKDREENILVEKSLQLNKENDHLEGTICVDLESVRLWDNHNPYLYHAYIELKAEDGSLAEVIPYDIGFRRIEIIDKVVYLNGKRLIITGVNRHEWNARTGRCIGIEDMKADISCMLRNNINSVRTCHYPDQIPWYYMCDDAGIYVMAETNLESHGSFQKLGAIEPSCNVPGSIPQWRDAVLERAKNNFETFKNHTSILFWSLGNESYAGDDIEAMNVYFAEKKDGRLVHYESSYYNRAYEDTISDFETRMYAKPEDVEEYLNNSPKKPYILCEFMHDMGNSMGGLGSYMKLIDKYDMYHGGFIWDFIDQAIMVKDSVTGKDVLRYGGDFDDKPSDYEFSANGIVFADRKEKPAMQEVRYYYGLYR